MVQEFRHMISMERSNKIHWIHNDSKTDRHDGAWFSLERRHRTSLGSWTPIVSTVFCFSLWPAENFQQCVWEEVYCLLNERLHADLFQVSERLANALELGRVVETSQKYAPNPEYYTRKRWFILEPEITIQATPFGDFLADQIRSTFPGDFHTLKEACFVLSKTMNSFPTLIEKFQKAEFIQLSHSADSTTTKFKGAVILHLDIPTFKTVGDAPQFPSVLPLHTIVVFWLPVPFYGTGIFDLQLLPNIKLNGCQFLVSIPGGAWRRCQTITERNIPKGSGIFTFLRRNSPHQYFWSCIFATAPALHHTCGRRLCGSCRKSLLGCLS